MESKHKYIIGYIDEDEGQVKIYRRRLKKYGFKVIGYEFVKGMSLDNLMQQVYNSDIDLLMIDYKLNESNIVSFNGHYVEKEIYENKPQFPHIIFTNRVPQAEPFVEDWKIIFSKGGVFEDEYTIERFVKMLKKSIQQYQNLVNKKKTILADLLKKEEKESLSSGEKNILLSTQEELYNLDKTQKREIPKQLVSYEKLDNLSKTRKEAEDFLNNLIMQNKKK